MKSRWRTESEVTHPVAWRPGIRPVCDDWRTDETVATTNEGNRVETCDIWGTSMMSSNSSSDLITKLGCQKANKLNQGVCSVYIGITALLNSVHFSLSHCAK